jgi:hypothetical protein
MDVWTILGIALAFTAVILAVFILGACIAAARADRALKDAWQQRAHGDCFPDPASFHSGDVTRE